MTVHGWLVTVLLLAAAVAVGWPVRAGRARQRAVLGSTRRDPVPSGVHVAGRAHRRGLNGARAAARRGRRGEQADADRPPSTRPPARRDATRPAVAPLPADGRRPRAALPIGPISAGATVTLAPGRAADPSPHRAGPRTGEAVGIPATRPVGPDAGAPAESAVHPVRGGPELVNAAGHGAPVAAPAIGRVHDGSIAALRRVFGPGAASKPETDGVAVGGGLPERLDALASRRGLLVTVLMLGGLGAVLGGPVAATVLAAYGVLAIRAFRRRRAHQLADQARRRELDQLCALAADLRAGLPAGGAVVAGPDRTARLARAAVRLADRTGAPLAELLERVEADARAADRGLAAAAAQAAGARATALLLAALPLGGIGLGYAIGVDPVAVLLHTTAGGGSALAAVGLQIGGLLWAERLGATPGRDD